MIKDRARRNDHAGRAVIQTLKRKNHQGPAYAKEDQAVKVRKKMEE